MTEAAIIVTTLTLWALAGWLVVRSDNKRRERLRAKEETEDS